VDIRHAVACRRVCFRPIAIPAQVRDVFRRMLIDDLERIQIDDEQTAFAEFFSHELKHKHSGKCGWHAQNSAPNGKGSDTSVSTSSRYAWPPRNK